MEPTVAFSWDVWYTLQWHIRRRTVFLTKQKKTTTMWLCFSWLCILKKIHCLWKVEPFKRNLTTSPLDVAVSNRRRICPVSLWRKAAMEAKSIRKQNSPIFFHIKTKYLSTQFVNINKMVKQNCSKVRRATRILSVCNWLQPDIYLLCLWLFHSGRQ